MPTVDNKIDSFIINKLTKAQYNSSSKDQFQFYACTDTGELFLGSLKLGATVQLVDELPSSPVEGVLYGIAEDE